MQSSMPRALAATGNPLSFFPNLSAGLTTEMLWTIPVATFLVNIGLQWWAFWYPGAEPGGGGYIAQRIFSARDERQGLLSVLWFNVAHYAIRPWPWILTALCVIVLYPGLAHPETGYMLVMNNYLPHSMRGLAIAGFLAAFMSTVATQLNWGASYLVSDFYRRFLRPQASNAHYVVVSRLATILLVIASAWVSVNLDSIASGWQVVMEVGAGTGAVYLLRWYWWRINAWSEISAMACSLAVTVTLNALHPFHGSSPVLFAKTALTTTVITTLVWLAVTLLTPAEPRATLEAFYRLVRPDVRGWQPIAAQLKPNHRRQSASHPAHPRSRPQPHRLASRLRHGLPLPLRNRQTPPPPARPRTHPARALRPQRLRPLSQLRRQLPHVELDTRYLDLRMVYAFFACVYIGGVTLSEVKGPAPFRPAAHSPGFLAGNRLSFFAVADDDFSRAGYQPVARASQSGTKEAYP